MCLMTLVLDKRCQAWSNSITSLLLVHVDKHEAFMEEAKGFFKLVTPSRVDCPLCHSFTRYLVVAVLL